MVLKGQNYENSNKRTDMFNESFWQFFFFILNTPKPDFTELNSLSKQFEDSMKKTRKDDLQKISKAV